LESYGPPPDSVEKCIQLWRKGKTNSRSVALKFSLSADPETSRLQHQQKPPGQAACSMSCWSALPFELKCIQLHTSHVESCLAGPKADYRLSPQSQFPIRFPSFLLSPLCIENPDKL
jgi:hypothetical protein